MKIHHLLSSFFVYFVFITLVACSSAPDRIGGLDLIKWRSDRGGCKDSRKAQMGDFKKIEKEIMGKHIDEVGQILGRPDIHQLGTRDQKFYVYFFEKGVHCNDIKQKSEAQKVILRFNAIGYLAEITYQTKPL